MTEQEKYVLAASAVFKDCLNVINQRSIKYTGTGDPFANFVESAAVAEVDVVQGIMTRFGDKLGRLKALLRQKVADGEILNEPVDESLKDTITDAINYLAIIRIWIESGDGEQLDVLLEDAGLTDGPQLKLPAFAEEAEAEKLNWFEKFLKR